MTSMPLWQQIATIALCVLGTMTTRFLPFLIFKPGSRLPGYVKYLGKALPSAVFALLVVYCLKDVSLLSGSHGIPEALGMGLTLLYVSGAVYLLTRRISSSGRKGNTWQKKRVPSSTLFSMVTGMGFEPILSALRTQRLNRLTNRPCMIYYT